MQWFYKEHCIQVDSSTIDSSTIDSSTIEYNVVCVHSQYTCILSFCVLQNYE